MRGDDWRTLVAAAIRRALEAGLRDAADPMAYLHTAQDELSTLGERLGVSGDEDEEREVQIIVVKEVALAVSEMMNRLRH
ncbi:hypothetical protein [Muricoccus radiodurans]|uniref:hypothetical protein n=1 Tax=Muricoccus radiodurans TaxID=2231721 RepID=UPI003CE78A09